MAIDKSPAPSNVSTEDAAKHIDALLARDDPVYKEEPVKESAEQEEVDEEVDDISAQAEEEVSESTEEQPVEESEVEAKEIDYDTLIEVKSKGEDGKEVVEEVPLKDLIQQRMLQSDYTRKTQDLARQRAEVQSELQSGIDKQRQEYIQALESQQQAFMNLLVPELQNLDQLADTDPAEYVRVKNRAEKFNSAVQQIEAKRQEAIQQHRQYMANEVVPKQMELLKQSIPDWGDSSKQAVIETGKKFGLTEEELGSIVDHRQIRILHELHRLSNLEKNVSDKKALAQKKVVEKPKVVKSNKTPKRESKSDVSMERLKKTGRWQDSVEAIAARLTDL